MTYIHTYIVNISCKVIIVESNETSCKPLAFPARQEIEIGTNAEPAAGLRGKRSQIYGE